MPIWYGRGNRRGVGNARFAFSAGAGTKHPAATGSRRGLPGLRGEQRGFDAGVGHGFVRTAGGQITTFNPPHSYTGPTSYGTYNAFINDLGVIAGSYFDASTYVEYG